MRDRRIVPTCCLLAGLFVAGCVNPVDRVAMRTLQGKDGRLDETVYSAALEAKFPPGASLAALRNYVVSLKGTCDVSSERTRCEIPTSRPACYTSIMQVDAVAEGDVIRQLHVERLIIEC